MARQVAIPYTFTTEVATYDSTNSTFYQQASGYPPENGFGDGTGTYAGFHLTRGSQAETIVWYGFNCDDIPNDATITNVSLSERAAMSTSTTNYVSQATLQLYSGTTSKGTAVTLTSTSETNTTISSPGTWTVAQLKDDLRVGVTISYSGLIITGITWTVNYTADEPAYYKYILSNLAADHTIIWSEVIINSDKFFIKQNNSWIEVSNIYLKQNGSWIEQDLSYLDNNNIKYLKQGS